MLEDLTGATSQTDTVDIVDEVIGLEEGFNLLSVPQPAALETQDVNSLNRWNSETQTYEAITSPEFDSPADLHNGLYVAADSNNARLGFTFDQNVPVGGTEDIDPRWNLISTNFAIDSFADGSVTIDQDLTGVGVADLELFTGDFQEFLDGDSTVDTHQAYWAFNPTGEADERATVSPEYGEQNRRAVLGADSQPSESDFEPRIRISDIEITSVSDADDQVTLDDRSVVGASEQVVLVDVTVENNGTGTDVQFVDLTVSPQFDGDLENATFERVDQTGVALDDGENETVTLAYIADQNGTTTTGLFDLAFAVATEDGESRVFGVPFNDGGITVSDQALTSDGEFVVDNVDVADRGTIELVNDTNAVLDSRQFSQGINEEIIFSDFSRPAVTDTVTVQVRGELGDVVTSETVTLQDSLIDVTNDAPSFALVGDVTEIPVEVENNARRSEDDEITFSAGGSQLDSTNISLAGGEARTVTFSVEPQALGLSAGDTVDHTVASSDDSDTQTLTVANASLSFNDQTLNTAGAPGSDGTVVVEDVTASADQKVVVTDTDFDIKGEVDVDTAINSEDVTIAVDTSAGAHVAHVVSETTDVSSAGPGLVSQQATVATVAIETISNKTIDEESLPNTVTDEVTVNIDAGGQSEISTVEIANEAGDVIGNATTDTNDNVDVTVSLDEPVIKNDTATETVVLDATLVGADGAEFDRPDANDGFQPFSDQESFEVTVTDAAANVALPDQALGSAEVTRETGGDGVSADNVVITLDTSGSMAGGKLTSAQDGAEVLVDSLSNNTQIGIVEFSERGGVSENGRVVQNLTTDKQAVKSAIQSLTAGGDTPMADGITTSQTLLDNQSAANDSNVMVVLADGDANVAGPGPTRDAAVDVRNASGINAAGDDTQLISIAFGAGANEQLMEDISSPPKADDGTIDDDDQNAFIGGEDDISQIFQDIGEVITQDQPAVQVQDVTGTAGQFVVITNASAPFDILGSVELQTRAAGDSFTVPVDVGAEGGNFRAHLASDAGLLGDDDALVTDEGRVFEPASVSISNQSFAGTTDQITVDSSNLQADGAANYRLVVHDQTLADNSSVGPAPSDVGPALGFSDVLTGNESDTTIDLGSTVTSAQDVLVMIHFPGDGGSPGSAIPVRNGSAFGFSDGQAGTITDTATLLNASVTISDQGFTNSTDQITVDSSSLQAASPAEYRLVVHDQTLADNSSVGPAPSDVGPALGFSDVLTGSESDTTIELGSDITSAQDVLVMIHFPGDGGSPGSAIPVQNGSAFGFSDGQAGTITDTARILNASVAIADQTVTNSTNQITVNSSNLQADGPANYRIVVHDQTLADNSSVGPAPSDVGPALGFSDVLTGSESDTTIELGSEINSTQDVLVMIHFPGDGSSPGSAIPVQNGSAFGFSDGQAGTVTDTAAIAVE